MGLKQLTLGSFGFTKTKAFDGKPNLIEILKFALETKKAVNCPECTKTFVNTQGLSTHLKCVHNASLNDVQPMLIAQPTTSTAENVTGKSTEDCPSAGSSHQNVSGNLLDVNTTPKQLVKN